MATPTNPTMSLKLLVDNNSKKVLFAEAGKDFVDFLFGILELPFGSILALMVEHRMAGAGSLGRVYESIQNLDNDYLQPNRDKDSLLKPKPATSNTRQSPLLKQLACAANQEFNEPRCMNIYDAHSNFTSSMVDGHVRGVVTYMVMDDLMVKPMSTISGITLLNTFRVKDIGCLEEKTVKVDMDKGLKLLHASFVSTTVLTDVFLPTKELEVEVEKKEKKKIREGDGNEKDSEQD